MKQFMTRVWTEEGGFITFEWILLVTLLTIGVVGGVAAVRDAVIDELGDVAQAMVSLDQSYSIIRPVEPTAHDLDPEFDGGAASLFIDTDCNHATNCRPDQAAVSQGPLCAQPTP